MAALPTTVFPRHPEGTLPITLGPSPPHCARPAIVRGQQCGQPERTSSDPASIARGQLCRYHRPPTPTHSAHAIQPCAAVMVLSECCAHLAKRRIVRSTDQLVRCSCVALAEACISLTSRGWMAWSAG